MGEVIRRSKGGKFIGYYLRWYEGGKRRQMASKQPTHAEAKRMLQAIEGRVAQGLDGIQDAEVASPPTPADVTVAELVERFLAEYSRPRIKDIVQYRHDARMALQRSLVYIGKRRVNELTVADVTRLRDSMSKSHAPASVRVSLSFLGGMFSWAIREGLASSNPCRGVERPASAGLLEFLTEDDAKRLLAYTRQHVPSLHPMIATALYCGLRKGELFGLTWSRLDFKTRRLDVVRSGRKLPKGGKPRYLRLPAILVPILAEWRKHCPATSEGLVFPMPHSRGISMGKSSDMAEIYEAMEAAGCPRMQRPWHALRHTFASHYIMRGGNILALQKILGHADIKMTLIYAHLAPDYLGDEMERVKFE